MLSKVTEAYFFKKFWFPLLSMLLSEAIPFIQKKILYHSRNMFGSSVISWFFPSRHRSLRAYLGSEKREMNCTRGDDHFLLCPSHGHLPGFEKISRLVKSFGIRAYWCPRQHLKPGKIKRYPWHQLTNYNSWKTPILTSSKRPRLFTRHLLEWLNLGW